MTENLETTADDPVVDSNTPAGQDESTSTAEELAGSTDDPGAEPAEGDDPEPGPGDGTSQSKLKKLVDTKYNGDEDAFHEALHEQWKSSARMAEEIRDLRSTIKELATVKEDLSKVIEAHPDVQWISEQLSDLQAESQKFEADRRTVLTRIGEADRMISRLEGQREAETEPYEKQLLLNRIEALKDKKEALSDKWEAIDQREKSAKVAKREYERQLGLVRKAVESEEFTKKKQKEVEVEQQKDTLKEFFSAAEAAAKRHGIPPANVKHMTTAIRGELALQLMGAGPEAEGIDIPEAVEARVAAYAKAMRLKPTSKPAAPANGAPTGKTAAPPKRSSAPTNTPRTAREAEAWIAKVLSGKEFTR